MRGRGGARGGGMARARWKSVRCGVEGLGLKEWGAGRREWDVGVRISELGFNVEDIWCRV
jgi:hypothetical protein